MGENKLGGVPYVNRLEKEVSELRARVAALEADKARLVAALGGLLDHGIPHLQEAWREPDTPNGRSAWREFEACEVEARALLGEIKEEADGHAT